MSARKLQTRNDIQLCIIKTPINIHHKVQKTRSLQEALGPNGGLRSELKMVKKPKKKKKERKKNSKRKKKKQYIKKFGIIIFNPSPQYTHKGLPPSQLEAKNKNKTNQSE